VTKRLRLRIASLITTCKTDCDYPDLLAVIKCDYELGLINQTIKKLIVNSNLDLGN